MRNRAALRVAGVLAAAAMLLVLGPGVADEVARADAGPGSSVPVDELHLPTAVNAPGTWSSAEDVRWPVAALGIATRTEGEGLFDVKESLQVFAVSAIDGGASWIQLPSFSLDRWGFVGGFAVSPDGQWVGWVRPQPSGPRASAERIGGWSIMNTTTGKVQQLKVPGFSWVRGTIADLAFSGDSRYLLTSYETPDQPKASRSVAHQFVAWDVESATPTVIEEPGSYWLPSLGSAPSGVVWSRGRNVFRVDPNDGKRTTVRFPQDVVTASWGPDDTSFAYIARPSEKSRAPWKLYAGRTIAEARTNPVTLPSGVSADQLLGWRDATHVVVGHYRETVHVVDVVTGVIESIDLSGYGEQINAPYLAGYLWQQPLVTPVPPDGTTDPRWPWRWFSGLVALLGAVFFGLWWTRSRRKVELTGTRTEKPQQLQKQNDPAHDSPTAHLRPWRALATASTGLVIVLIDLRFHNIDLIPDPVGWVMAAIALSSLRAAHRGFYFAGVAAWLAVIPALPEWVGVESVVIASSVAIALFVVQFATCTAVMAVSPDWEPSAVAIRWLSLGLGLALVVAIAAASAEPSVGILVFAIVLAELGVSIWFLVLLYKVAKEAPAHRPLLQRA